MRQWSPIIPKSLLFVVSDMKDDETKWEIALQVNPTSKIPLIIIVDIVFLLILGMIIIILHLREKVSQLRNPNKILIALLYFRLKTLAKLRRSKHCTSSDQIARDASQPSWLICNCQNTNEQTS